MTLLEKAMKDMPQKVANSFIEKLCPSDLGLTPPDDPCDGECQTCWNREAPDGKTDCHTSAAALARNDGGGPDNGG